MSGSGRWSLTYQVESGVDQYLQLRCGSSIRRPDGRNSARRGQRKRYDDDGSRVRWSVTITAVDSTAWRSIGCLQESDIHHSG